MYVTVLPQSDEYVNCAPVSYNTTISVILKRFVKLTSGFGFGGISDNSVICGDYIYSGHTMILVTCYLVVQGKLVMQ